MDLAFKGAPLSFRIGRQQIVWGETDNFRLLDRVNALDLTWHLQQETEIGHSWDQLRIPYWGIKGLYQVGNLGPVNNGYLEAFWNPGTWQPNKRRFLPYSPWSNPIGSPIDYAGVFPGGLASGTLYIQGDYARNIKENSRAASTSRSPTSIRATTATTVRTLRSFRRSSTRTRRSRPSARARCRPSTTRPTPTTSASR